MKNSRAFAIACAFLACFWMLPAFSDTIYVTGLECPGLGFLAGRDDFMGTVVGSGPDVDVGQICDAINPRPISGFGGGGYPHQTDRDDCIATGGRWTDVFIHPITIRASSAKGYRLATITLCQCSTKVLLAYCCLSPGR
jgi:hypothetical protein